MGLFLKSNNQEVIQMLGILLLLVLLFVAIGYSASFLVPPCPNCKSLRRFYRYENDERQSGERIQVEICTGCGKEISRVPLSEITKAQRIMQDAIEETKDLTDHL